MSLFTPEAGAPLPRQDAIDYHLAAIQPNIDQQDVQQAAYHANRVATLLNRACTVLRALVGGKDGA